MLTFFKIFTKYENNQIELYTEPSEDISSAIINVITYELFSDDFDPIKNTLKYFKVTKK